MRIFLRDMSAQIAAAATIAAAGVLGVKLASLTPVIAAYAPFSYLVAFLVISIAAAAFLFGAGKAKQALWPSTPKAPETYDDTEIRDKVDSSDEILAGIVRDVRSLTAKVSDDEKLIRKIIDDYQCMLALEARFSDEMDKLKEFIDSKFETARSNHEALQERVLTAESASSAEKLKIQSALHTIWMREEITKVSVDLREDATYLTQRLQEGKQLDAKSWDSWLNVYTHWSGLMNQWWMMARFYLANTKQVMSAPDHMFAKTQVDESLLTPVGGAEAVRIYKKFRIMQDQWEAVQPELHNNLILVAFSGITEMEVRHGQPVEQG
jgi:hypothetical protein